MADINTSINGIPVVLTDNGDGTYIIDLSTQQARSFIREELNQLREKKALDVSARDSAEADRVRRVAQRDSAVVTKTASIALIDESTLRIGELVAFLQGQGDDT